MIAECVRAWLEADAIPRINGMTVWERIGAYPTGGDNKACFTFDPPPMEGAQVTLDDPQHFAVTIIERPGPAQSSRVDTRLIRGLDQDVQVRIYGAKQFSHKALCDMAYAVTESLYYAGGRPDPNNGSAQSFINVPGWNLAGLWVGSPGDVADAIGLPAYQVNVLISLSQQSGTTTGAP